MKKIGIIILAIVILAGIAALTLLFQVIEFFVGIILFIVAVFVLGYLYSKAKDKLED